MIKTFFALNNKEGSIELIVCTLNSFKFFEARDNISFSFGRTAKADSRPRFDKSNFTCEDYGGESIDISLIAIIFSSSASLDQIDLMADLYIFLFIFLGLMSW